MRGHRETPLLAPVGSSDQPSEQLTLSAVEQRFVAAGIASDATDMPEGLDGLTAKELRFVLGVLEHGQMAKAATDAGYSVQSAGSIASETLRRPKVFAFYRRCLEKVANKAELLTARVYERSVVFHAKALQAMQDLEDANEWLLAVCKDETSYKHGAKNVKEYEMKRERAQRDQKHYATLANQTDALLGQLLGKIAGLNVSGEITHKHKLDGALAVTVPEEALPALAQIRRDVVVGGGSN